MFAWHLQLFVKRVSVDLKIAVAFGNGQTEVISDDKGLHLVAYFGVGEEEGASLEFYDLLGVALETNLHPSGRLGTYADDPELTFVHFGVEIAGLFECCEAELSGSELGVGGGEPSAFFGEDGRGGDDFGDGTVVGDAEGVVVVHGAVEDIVDSRREHLYCYLAYRSQGLILNY